MVGLLSHSVADGLALGASSLSAPSTDSGSSSLSLIVFLAILLHKFPTAFALSTLLRRSSTPRFTLTSLAAFSLASPLSAVTAFNVLCWMGADSSSTLSWWTGLVLVFSGGTFLFVATTVMKGGAEEEHGEGWQLGEHRKVVYVCLGMLTPALLSELVHYIKQ